MTSETPILFRAEAGEEARMEYPFESVAFEKEFKAAGMTVAWDTPAEQRNFTTKHSAEIWLPIIEFASNVASGAVAGVIAAALERRFGRRDAREVILHVDFRTTDSAGNKVRLKSTGDSASVLEALREVRGRDEE